MTVRVVTAPEAAAADAAAIAAGTPSMELMRRAGSGATRVLLERYAEEAARGVLIYTGSGNNGGDGWIVAAGLAGLGCPVWVNEVQESRTDEALSARADARGRVSLGEPTTPPGVVVDAIVGTGTRGAPRGAAAGAVTTIRNARAGGAIVVALDLPTGLDATTGEADASVVADLTVSFGSVKRGHLIARSRCGEIVVVDIGISDVLESTLPGTPRLVDAEWAGERIPPITAEAHKGTRRRVLMVGGARGMAGAMGLASRAAFRSGVGMVRLCVAAGSVAPLQAAVMEATAVSWPADGDAPDDSLTRWPHALLIGPGFGDDAGARSRAERWLSSWQGPVVVDADALNAFAGDIGALGTFLAGRPAIVTPHPVECARLAGVDVATVLAQRFEIGARLAGQLHAVVLLKGVPTVISSPNGEVLVSATGTPVLGTAGSGDVLSGIGVTLLAQMDDAHAAAACAAWAHGRAGEFANAGRPVRGVTLDDVLARLPDVWRRAPVPREEGVLAVLPRVGEA